MNSLLILAAFLVSGLPHGFPIGIKKNISEVNDREN